MKACGDRSVGVDYVENVILALECHSSENSVCVGRYVRAVTRHFFDVVNNRCVHFCPTFAIFLLFFI